MRPATCIVPVRHRHVQVAGCRRTRIVLQQALVDFRRCRSGDSSPFVAGLKLLSSPGWRGLRLDRESRSRLEERAGRSKEGFDAAFVIADGLSAFAVEENAVPFLDAALAKLDREGWRIAPMLIGEQGRVAVGDEVGQVLAAGMVAILIGERPGLSSPDSMGIYLTYHPRVGTTDAQRNCISNIRREGMSCELAAHKLHYLMSEARRRKLTGVDLKDESEAPRAIAAGKNFLIETETPEGRQ